MKYGTRIHWLALLATVALVAPPSGAIAASAAAVHEDESATASDDSTAEADGKKKKNPIRKLVEIRVDPFLVPARQFNVPIPGRIRTTQDLLDQLEKLGKDEDVAAILLNLDGVALPLPDVEAVSAGIQRFRDAGKEVKAFLNSGDPSSYLLACAADEIAIAPSGMLVIPGLGRVFPFMRGMYQMQGIEFDVITAGAFKYPGYNTSREPNEYFVQEFEEIMDSWYGDYVSVIATGRDIPEADVRDLVRRAEWMKSAITTITTNGCWCATSSARGMIPGRISPTSRRCRTCSHRSPRR